MCQCWLLVTVVLCTSCARLSIKYMLLKKNKNTLMCSSLIISEENEIPILLMR